jgi:uncharacterized protein (DUF1778 family)
VKRDISLTKKQKRTGESMRKRNISIPIRVTEKELEEIDAKALKAKKNRTEYLISSALGKEITIIDDLKEVTVQLRRIGNNLNQLTKKAKVDFATDYMECLGEDAQTCRKLVVPTTGVSLSQLTFKFDE